MAKMTKLTALATGLFGLALIFLLGMLAYSLSVAGAKLSTEGMMLVGFSILLVGLAALLIYFGSTIMVLRYVAAAMGAVAAVLLVLWSSVWLSNIPTLGIWITTGLVVLGALAVFVPD
jgi:hypothetical protein